MKLTYVSRPGSGTSAKEIQCISVALRAVEQKFGCITPAVVVKAAEPPRSPLHRFFQWNNDAAAESYRLWQARQLIAKVYIVDKQRPGIGPVRAFVNLQIPSLEGEGEDNEEEANQRAYLDISKLKNRQDFTSQLLAYAYQQLVGWKKRFGDYKQFLGVSKEIEKIKV